MIVRTRICESPEGRAFRERIVGQLTRTFFSESEYPATLDYLDSGAEDSRFSGKDTAGALRALGVDGHRVSFVLEHIAEHPALTFSSGPDDGPVIMYIHGGAYVFGYTAIYFRFNEVLAERCGAKVVAPVYPLASGERQGVHEAAYAQLVSAYLELAREGRPVFVMGDSSGGAMALRLAQTLKMKDIVPPAGLVLLSPFADASFSDTVDRDLAERDITVDLYGLDRYARLWAGGTPLDDPRISPLFGDMSGLPPMLLVTATDEVFLPSVHHLSESVDAAGGDVELIECEGSYHIFPVYTELPESRAVMDAVKRFCRDRSR